MGQANAHYDWHALVEEEKKAIEHHIAIKYPREYTALSLPCTKRLYGLLYALGETAVTYGYGGNHHAHQQQQQQHQPHRYALTIHNVTQLSRTTFKGTLQNCLTHLFAMKATDLHVLVSFSPAHLFVKKIHHLTFLCCILIIIIVFICIL